MSIDCENNYLSADKQIQTLLRTASNPFSSGVINGLAVDLDWLGEDAIEPAINCNNNHLTFIDLLLLSIGTDGCGKPALRAIFIDSCDLVKNCDNNPYGFLNSIFAYNSTQDKYAIVFVQPTP